MTKQQTGTEPSDPSSMGVDTLGSWQEVHNEVAVRFRSSFAELALSGKIQHPDSAFDDLTIKAITGCMIQHRFNFLRRPSEHRKELVKVCKRAKVAAEAMAKLSSALDHLVPEVRILLGEKWGSQGIDRIKKLPLDAIRFEQLAELSGQFANIPEDRGGPSKMQAFRVLVTGLAKAFEQARKRPAKVTWKESEDVYSGDFLSLVETTLRLLRKVMIDDEPPLECPPTPNARGKYVYDMTRAGRQDTE